MLDVALIVTAYYATGVIIGVSPVSGWTASDRIVIGMWWPLALLARIGCAHRDVARRLMGRGRKQKQLPEARATEVDQ